MNIFYKTEQEFYSGVFKLLKAGITFDAYHDKYVIKLTGGWA